MKRRLAEPSKSETWQKFITIKMVPYVHVYASMYINDLLTCQISTHRCPKHNRPQQQDIYYVCYTRSIQVKRQSINAGEV